MLITGPASAGEYRPAVLWFHGGGMIIGSPQLEAPTAARFARQLDAVVV